MISERELIAKIKGAVGGSANLIKGIGDDCAVFSGKSGMLNLVSVDTLVEGVHFDLTWHAPAELGHKAAAVNISDIAAMGGIANYMLLSIAAPSSTSSKWLDDFMAGFLDELATHHITLIGGDTVSSPQGLSLSITVMGEVADGQVLYRSGAYAGDSIMVSGSLGDAGMGLEICRQGRQDLKSSYPELVAAHLKPRPELKLGHLLATSGMVNAMLDMSDGLGTDLAHLCECSGLGADIEASLLPVSDASRQVALALNMDANRLAVSGGEDYRLLFTCSANDEGAVKKMVYEALGRELFQIGKMISGSGVNLYVKGKKSEIAYQGYEHFM